MSILTISIPTYNASSYLKDNLSGIILELESETFNADEIEIVISDNCSTDDTEKVVEDFKLQFEKYNVDIRYYRNEKNLGLDKNVKNCIEKATGDFIHCLCDDDYYTKGAISRILKVIKEDNSLDFILLSNNYLNVFDGKILDNKGLETDITTCGIDDFVKKSELKELCLSNCIFKKEKFKDCNIEKYYGMQWPHIALIAKSMNANFKSYIFSFSKPLVTIRFGNQRWAIQGGAISFFYNCILLYKILAKRGFIKEFKIIENNISSYVIDAKSMKYDAFSLNLKYIFLFLINIKFLLFINALADFMCFSKELLFARRRKFGGGG